MEASLAGTTYAGGAGCVGGVGTGGDITSSERAEQHWL